MWRRLTIVHLLGIANAILLLAASGVGWDMARRYGELVYGFNASNAQKIADGAVDEVAWREYAQAAGEAGRHIAQGDTLRKQLTQKDAAAVSATLADEFGRAAFSSGQVKVLGLTAYDASMALIGEAWRGTAAAIPAAVREELVKREGADRLKILSRVWRNGDEPRLSVFVPVGGLRLIGYLAIHTDPIHALAQLDQRLGMAVEIIALAADRSLLAPGTFRIADGAAVHETTLLVHAPGGQAIARLKVRQDVSDLTAALSAAALWSLGAFVLICGGIAAGAVTFVAMFTRQVRQREAAAQAQLERQRRDREAADAARQQGEREAEAARRDELLRLADTFEASVKSVVDVVSQSSTDTSAHAESLAGDAERAAGLAVVAADAAQQASANVQTLADASQDMSNATAEIARQVAKSSDIAGKAVAEAGDTNTAMRGLAEAAQKIGEVVNLINAIAAQTNLLALNATIEAARAGDAGRGFAVVAGEVKLLATQTANATKDISAQIGAIRSSTGDAVAAIERVGRTIGEISAIATSVAAAVEEQDAAAREIARNVSTAATGARDASVNIAGVREAATETGRVSNLVLTDSRELTRQAETLHREVERFLSTVRAA
jgi:methyl-accepting chemotaxis protein